MADVESTNSDKASTISNLRIIFCKNNQSVEQSLNFCWQIFFFFTQIFDTCFLNFLLHATT